MNRAIPNYIQYGEIVNSSVADYFSIITVNDLRKAHRSHTPHRHTFLYQICWIEEGDYFVNIDTERYHLEKHSFIVLPPNTVHAATFSDNLEGFIIHFSEDFLGKHINIQPHYSSIIKKNLTEIDSIIRINEVTAKELHFLFENISSTYHSDSMLKNDILRSYLNIVLLKIYESSKLIDRSSNPEFSKESILNKFFYLLDQKFKEKKSVQEYAELLHISPGYLNAVAKKLTQTNASDIIRDKIIFEAQKSLIYTDNSVSEIAFEFNYNDSSYFWKFFKKNVGISPKEYRKQYR